VSFFESSETECGSGNVNGSNTAVSLQTASIPALWTCFNLNETFTQPNVTYNQRGYTCSGNEPCGVNYTMFGADNFDATANYSQVFYSQQGLNAFKEEEPELGSLIFQVYSGYRCSDLGDNRTIQPWVRWSCASEIDCAVVPFNIRSFAMLPSSSLSDDAKKRDCDVGREYGGSGAGMVSVKLGWTLLIAVILALLLR
jgi:hypothetical protein